MRKALTILTIASFLSLSVAGEAEKARADTLQNIRREGVVRIGVKVDYPPFGYIEYGNNLGIEIDIARDLAKELGVTPDFVAVSASTRNDKLIEGDIDLFIATMSDTPGRRKVVGAIEPNYYAAGINLLARNDVVKSWQDLEGKPVCGIDGAYFNSVISERYGTRVVEDNDLDEAKEALRNGDCVALLYDDALIRQLISLPEWSDFEMPVDSEDVTPWAIAVRPEDRGAPLGILLSGFICRLHKSGRLLNLETNYGLMPSRFLLRMAKNHRNKLCDSAPTQ
jgi:polar amino acid transport system substrate-binding protein